MQTIQISIEGMTCGGCVKSVTGVLQKIDGVSSVNVSLEQKRADIQYDESKTSPAAFKQAIEDAGYDVTADQA
jgi:copper chaperone